MVTVLLKGNLKLQNDAVTVMRMIWLEPQQR